MHIRRYVPILVALATLVVVVSCSSISQRRPAAGTRSTSGSTVKGSGSGGVAAGRGRGPEQAAAAIAVNAKVQRPSVCNAAESLVVHGAVADEFLPRVAADLEAAGVELVGDERARAIVAMGVATEDDFSTEFLALKMSVAVVEDLSAAIGHINRFGSGHTEAIVTRELAAAERFQREVDTGLGPSGRQRVRADQARLTSG